MWTRWAISKSELSGFAGETPHWGEEGEVDDGNIKGGRDGDEGRVALGEREAGLEVESKGVDKAKCLGEGEASVDVVRGIDDESGGDEDGVPKKGEGVVGDGEGLMIGRWRERNLRTEPMEGFGFRVKAIDGLTIGGR
ncbi:hypothetical protein CDL15_Pgr029169 [Punica granatum]|uniref:Uncharacterized protein n=1 Tax=Punica granatum TaxID=22663 RepID=A0A218XDC8_PUNGR|nr:hypothetical protein CDL15_Pgr029169 [Punica granatum]PKI65453.1 hypothetical protein CRG98_014192 [Punica granatum]